MIDINIKDGLGTSNKTEVTSGNALHVVTEEYLTYSTVSGFFINPNFGIDLNLNFSTQTGELIHNGGDSTAWTGVQTVGTSFTFDASNNPETGTRNISCVVSTNGDIVFFERGSDITITNEVALEGAIYIDAIVNIASEVYIVAWDSGTLTTVGTEVSIYDYVNISILDQYQTFTIPIADLDLANATFDSIRLRIDKTGQTFDLDNIEFTVAGGGSVGTQIFTIEPARGRQLVIDGFIITMADDYAGTVINGTMPDIPFQGFLGLGTLDSGMLFRVINNATQTTFIANLVDLIEFFQFGDTKFNSTASDGTNTWFTLKMNLPAPIILNADEKDRIELVLSDNFAGLLWFRWSVDARQRTLF